MAVTRLGAGAGGTGTTTASWTGFNFTSSDANTVCIVLVNWSTGTNATATCSVKYDTAGANVTMTQLGIQLGGATTSRSGCGIYYLFNPGVGAKNITVTPAVVTPTQVRGIDIAASGVGSVGAIQSVTTMAHTVTSQTNGLALRVLSNGVTTGTLGGPAGTTTELAAGASVTGVGDFVAVQSAPGAATVAFTASGTATTPISSGTSLGPVFPKMDTFIADFDAGLDANFVATLSDDPTKVTASSGAIRIDHTAAAQYNRYTSTAVYDMAGSSCYVRINDFGNQTLASQEVILLISLDTNNQAWITAMGGNLYSLKKIGGSQTQTGTQITLDTVNHRWFRIRESGGTLFFDTAPDPVGTTFTWTNRWTLTNPWSINGVSAWLLSGCWQAEASATYAIFDNFNTTGAAAVNTANFFVMF